MAGIYSTHVGYTHGTEPQPTYKKVCTGTTGHSEVCRLVFKPEEISLATILTIFWENHDPTRRNRQGNDRGTQYRSGIYYYSQEQRELAIKSKTIYEKVIGKNIVTEIKAAKTF